jgi:hypothetical protein
VGHSVPWDVLRVGRFKSWTFSDGTFLEWDVSRAGPFVCAPTVYILNEHISILRAKEIYCKRRNMVKEYVYRDREIPLQNGRMSYFQKVT